MGGLVRDALLVAKKELVHLSRDKRSQVLTLVLPIVAMAAFSLSFGGQNFQPTADSVPYPMAVKDMDASAESVQFIDILSRTQLFTLHILPADRNASVYMKENGIYGTLLIPDGFGEAFRNGKPQIGFLYDNSKPYVGALTLSRVKLVLEAIALQQGRGVDFRYQELIATGGALDIFTPGIVVLLIAFTSLNDMATSLTRERSDGTLGRVFISPVSKTSFLLGKILACLLLVFFRAVAILALAIFALGVRFHGDILTFLVLALLVGLVTLGIGILLAARAKSDREVMVATLMVVIVLMFMMGAITPVDLMGAPGQFIAGILPHTHATSALRQVMLLGYGLGQELTAVGILVGSTLVLMIGGAWLFKRTVD
ncbi:MAG: ABC transporter permease [Euryarchaeota archaeon]|nr:ABC transporter permease [Euryarchaeota archaeon]